MTLRLARDGLVEVAGARPRIVPVLADWEDILINQASATPINPAQFLFRPKRASTRNGMISNFLDKLTKGRVRVNPQRMRVTWIVTHLTAATPVKPLVAAAGVDSLEALTRYLRHVPDIDPAEWRARMRHAGGGAGP